MILLQLSAGTGPIECCRAVALAVQTIERECQAQGIGCELLEVTQANAKTGVACFKSVLLQLSANDEARAKHLALSWQGAMLWSCQAASGPGTNAKTGSSAARCLRSMTRLWISKSTFRPAAPRAPEGST